LSVFRLRNRPLSLALQGALGTTVGALASTVIAAPPRFNVALASNGATATASSTYSSAYSASSVINGDRKGLPWGANGGWNDATDVAFPDSVTIQFQSVQTIDEVRVYTIQDNYSAPIDPTLSATFTLYGATAFSVAYKDGSGAFIDIPGASVTGNNKVGNQFLFTAINTDAIKLTVSGGVDNHYSRIAEVEAWSDALNPPNIPPATQINDDFIKIGSASDDGPTATLANTALLAKWKNYFGDFVGKTGQKQGGPPYASASTNGQFVEQLLTFDVTQLAQELLVRNVGIYVNGTDCRVSSKEHPVGPKPELIVVTSVGSYNLTLRHDVQLTETSNVHGTDTDMHPPFVLDFDFSGVLGAIQSAALKLWVNGIFTASNPVALNVWKLDPPIIYDAPETQIGGVQAGLRGGYSNEAEFAAAAPGLGLTYIKMDAANFNSTTWDGHFIHTDSRGFEFKTWDDYGVSAVRLQSAGWNLPNPGGAQYLANTLSSERKNLGVHGDGFYNYTIKFDIDADLFAPDGGKLPGLNHDGRVDDANYWEARTHFSKRSLVNPNVRHLGWYFYNPDHPYSSNLVASEPDNQSIGYFRLAKEYTVEVYHKMNTRNPVTGAWNRDGIRRMWLNGVPVWESLDDLYTLSTLIQLDQIFFNVFYGGPDLPAGVFHVEVGPSVFSHTYVGPMKKKLPTWLDAIPADGKFHEVPGTAPSLFNLDGPGYWSSNAFDTHWNGLQYDEVNNVVYSGKAGGHNASMQQNGVYKQDLMRNQPIWELVRASTRYTVGGLDNGINMYFPDGRPVAAHTYYDGYVVIINGHPWLIFIGSDASTPSSGIRANVDAFDIDGSGDWALNGGDWPPMPITFNSVGLFGKPCCKNPLNQKLYVAGPFSGGTILEFDPATKAWAVITWSYPASIGRGMCFDTARNRLVFDYLDFVDTPTFGVWEFGVGFSRHTLLGVDIPTLANAGGYPCIMHDTISDRYIWITSGQYDPTEQGIVYSIHPQTWVCTRIDQVPIGREPGGRYQDPQYGIMNRACPMPALGGIAYHPGWFSNLWFRKS
jgi:hypothetical protein